MTRTNPVRGRGFSLLELLVTIGIVSVLAALLAPLLSRSLDSAQSSTCQSNLRQLAIAATLYAAAHDGAFPPAYALPVMKENRFIRADWDFTTVMDWNEGGRRSKQPGLLWQGQHAENIHQCPVFEGSDNALDDPYSGYNYNTSYIGHGPGEINPEPARVGQVSRPAETALFGDGEFANGANKFMRAPLDDATGGGDQVSFRFAGTQGYRHMEKTNVAFVEGHVATHTNRFAPSSQVADHTGFLTEDNHLYDLN